MVRVLGLKEEQVYGTSSHTTPDWHQEVSKAQANLNSEPIIYTGGSRMIRKTKAGALKPEASYEMMVDLKRIGHYFKAALGNYKFTAGATAPAGQPPNLNTHDFWGGESAILPSFTGWSTFDIFTKQLRGMVCESLQLEVEDETMKGSSEWKYQTETKSNTVPSNLIMPQNDALIAFYEVTMQIDNATTPGIVTTLNFEISNNLEDDKTRGLGARGPQIQPKAQVREIELEFESTMVSGLLPLIERAEYGAAGTSPTACSIGNAPLRIKTNLCPPLNDTLEILFPKCTLFVEYETSEADPIDVKFTLKTVGTNKATFTNPNHNVMTDIFVRLRNDQPIIRPGPP